MQMDPALLQQEISIVAVDLFFFFYDHLSGKLIFLEVPFSVRSAILSVKGPGFWSDVG